MIQKASVLGLGISLGGPEAIVEELRGTIATRRFGRTVCAVNVHTFTEAQRDPSLRRAINDADIAFVDGVPIRWLLRADGHAPPQRIHGADLTLRILLDLPGIRHTFFGSTTETLSSLKGSLLHRFPGLCIADMISPPFHKTARPEDPALLERINHSGADVLWVGLGAPKQELWMALNAGRLKIPVCLGVGAAFDILAGRYSRAPRFLQRLGLEWAWRLAQDPARLWRRYFSTNGYFLALLLREASRRLFRPTPPGSSSPGS